MFNYTEFMAILRKLIYKFTDIIWALPFIFRVLNLLGNYNFTELFNTFNPLKLLEVTSDKVSQKSINSLSSTQIHLYDYYNLKYKQKT